jgi:hypothetical protein
MVRRTIGPVSEELSAATTHDNIANMQTIAINGTRIFEILHIIFISSSHVLRG